MNGIVEERQAFAFWLRTGRRLPLAAVATAAIEHKFNPYHDPRDGRFTFAPGGAGHYRTTATPRRAAIASVRRTELERRIEAAEGRADMRLPGILDDGVYRPQGAPKLLRPIAAPPRRPRGIGDNSRAAHDPITLEQAFPGLRNSSAGAVLALADGVFDFQGPAGESVAASYEAQRRGLVADIKTLQPNFRDDQLAPPNTFEAKVAVINQLRARRAADRYLIKGELHELQVETIRSSSKQPTRLTPTRQSSSVPASCACGYRAKKRSATT